MHPLSHKDYLTLSLAGTVGAIALAFSVIAVPAASPQRLANGLERVEGSKAKLAYVRPGTNWSKYKTILLKPLEIPPDARDGGSGQTRRFRESYILGDKEVTALQGAYDKTMRDVLAKAGYTFVTTPGADTLVIAGQVLKIRLNAPIESTRGSYSGRGTTYSQGGGSMSIAGALADGQSNLVLAAVVDHSYPTSLWQVNNRVTNMADARRAFAKFAQSLSDTLKR